ncbi:MAG: type II 3-dehydroquinate dehydratase [Acholeplasma sp.]|nr:type II 3-dehydroquinate dehydratase [Acholeplasma sp.]
MYKGLIIHGPNLNKLGRRSQTHYGSLTMDGINHLLTEAFPNVSFVFFQSNHEGEIIDYLQRDENYDFVVMNPGGLAHYSIALRDAFELVCAKKAIVHLSDIEKRESFRQTDLFKDLADVYFKGLKEYSYVFAIKELIEKHLQ